MTNPSSPMWQQYHELKALHPDAILFFRMGDFYEMFFDDAVLGARELELTLTSRNKNDEDPIPMAGVPHHAAASYIERLVGAGHKVAIAEQVEDPALAKGLVRREVVRVVTPGVAFDPTSLDGREPSRIVAISKGQSGFGLAFLDVSTGDLRVTELADEGSMVSEIERMEPREALIAPGLELPMVRETLRRGHAVLSTLEEEAWHPREALRELKDTLGVTDVRAFGVENDDPSVQAAGALIRYGRNTTGGALKNVHRLQTYRTSGFMAIDESTRRNLELVRTLLGGQRKGTLLWLLDQAATAMGSRRIREWLLCPLLDVEEIRARQGAVTALVDDEDARSNLRGVLREVADIERIGARIAQGTANPRDLSALRKSLHAVPRVRATIARLNPLNPYSDADACSDVLRDLETWLVDDPPISLDEGGVIRRTADPKLDELVRASVDGIGWIAALEEKERELTGIGSLKIRRNNVSGYYIEVTRAQVHKAPDRYLRKQTLTTGERFITPELKELEEKVLGADEQRIELERKRFSELRDRVGVASARLLLLAQSLATLDALAGLADVAVRHRWTCPEVNLSVSLEITGGRHPVVEVMLADDRFVPNDIRLDIRDRRLVILTGPNMAGKSTVLRQAALIVLLAQVGSHVPAESAKVGISDRIFSRVGAVDDLARGQSTFMVEMAETAAILHQATARSFVILDEIGRGTSTYDGLAIAWAVAEDLAVRIRCRGLFATHYHELCTLADEREGVVNQSVAVHESGDRIVFLRRLREGGASRSYGIQCARIAGLPNPVIERARELLRHFECHAPRDEKNQLSLFATASVPTEPVRPEPPDPVRVALEEVDPDALTPRQAHDVLYRLKSML